MIKLIIMIKIFNHLIAFTSLLSISHTSFILSQFVVKSIKTTSFFWILLCRNYSFTKATNSGSFLLKNDRNISLLLISSTLYIYQSSQLPSCLLLTRKQTGYAVWWKLFCCSSRTHLTQENFNSPSTSCLFFEDCFKTLLLIILQTLLFKNKGIKTCQNCNNNLLQ